MDEESDTLAGVALIALGVVGALLFIRGMRKGRMAIGGEGVAEESVIDRHDNPYMFYGVVVFFVLCSLVTLAVGVLMLVN